MMYVYGPAQVVNRFGAKFWSAAPSRYPDEAQSLATAPGVRPHRIRKIETSHVSHSTS